nr:MauE/DoxX family redox-associated membrane protein [Pedobacter panaciterrae]
MEAKLLNIIYSLFILLWVYTAGSKLADFNNFKHEMSNQVFPAAYASFLIYILPSIEIITSLLLFSSKTRIIGLYVSFLLILVFTVYVGLAVMNVYEQIPCSCGGILKYMSWEAHLMFNMCLLLLAITGIYIQRKKTFSLAEKGDAENL